MPRDLPKLPERLLLVDDNRATVLEFSKLLADLRWIGDVASSDEHRDFPNAAQAANAQLGGHRGIRPEVLRLATEAPCCLAPHAEEVAAMAFGNAAELVRLLNVLPIRRPGVVWFDMDLVQYLHEGERPGVINLLRNEIAALEDDLRGAAEISPDSALGAYVAVSKYSPSAEERRFALPASDNIPEPVRRYLSKRCPGTLDWNTPLRGAADQRGKLYVAVIRGLNVWFSDWFTLWLTRQDWFRPDGDRVTSDLLPHDLPETSDSNLQEYLRVARLAFPWLTAAWVIPQSSAVLHRSIKGLLGYRSILNGRTAPVLCGTVFLALTHAAYVECVEKKRPDKFDIGLFTDAWSRMISTTYKKLADHEWLAVAEGCSAEDGQAFTRGLVEFFRHAIRQEDSDDACPINIEHIDITNGGFSIFPRAQSPDAKKIIEIGLKELALNPQAPVGRTCRKLHAICTNSVFTASGHCYGKGISIVDGSENREFGVRIWQAT